MKLKKEALEAVRDACRRRSRTASRALLCVVEPSEPDDIGPVHSKAVLIGMAQAERGEIGRGSAADIVDAAFRRHET